MRVMSNIYGMILIILFLITNPVQASDSDKCAPDYDISQIRNIPLDENAKYVFNEVKIVVNRPLEKVFDFIMNEPLENMFPGTDSLPGVRSTRSLNNIDEMQEGYLRVVCLDDGNTGIEKIIKNIPNEYFSYEVWDISVKLGKYVEYAKGEFWFSSQGDKTHIRWRYSFKLNPNTVIGKTGPVARTLVKYLFLKRQYNDLMVASLNAIKEGAENKIETTVEKKSLTSN